MQVQPYLFFEGRCEEAIEFYRKTLGAEVTMLMRFKEMPEPRPDGVVTPENANKVMHASLRIGESTVNVSDGNCQGAPGFHGFSLTVQAHDEAEADRLFNALAEGGTVRMPMAKTFFSPRFGMLADRFGVGWMLIVHAETMPGASR